MNRTKTLSHDEILEEKVITILSDMMGIIYKFKSEKKEGIQRDNSYADALLKFDNLAPQLDSKKYARFKLQYDILTKKASELDKLYPVSKIPTGGSIPMMDYSHKREAEVGCSTSQAVKRIEKRFTRHGKVGSQ